jgi:hypothetical protein
VWYWNQVSIAILAGIVAEVRAHKLHAIRVLILGWVLLFLPFWLQMIPLRSLVLVSPHFWYSVWNSFKFPFTFINVPYALLWWAGVGWLLARLHRPHPRAMLTLFVISLVPVILLRSAEAVISRSRLLDLSWQQYVAIVNGVILPPICLLLGSGVFKSRRHSQRHISGA